MVHLFTIQGRYKSFSCLARVTNGVYEVESIDGHSADAVPSLVLARAKHKIATMQPTGHLLPPKTTSAPHCDIDSTMMADDFATNFDNMKW